MGGTGAAAILSVAVGLWLAWLTRGIIYYSINTDNERLAQAAAKLREWRLPSGMHRYAQGKAAMKEFAVLCLAVVQRLIGDRTSDYALVLLCVAANAASALLIYVIATGYWGGFAGALAFGLFLSSAWPQLIALWGGVVALSQLCCLLSILCFQIAEHSAPAAALVWLLLGGLSIGAMLFASPSSRKYLVLSAGAFIWSMRGAMNGALLSFPPAAPVGPALGVLLVAAALAAASLAAKIVPAPFARLAAQRLKLRSQAAAQLVRVFSTGGLAAAAVLAANLAASTETRYWAGLGSAAAGILTVALLLIYGDILQNLFNYYYYSSYGTEVFRNRFSVYQDYFASLGRPIGDDMRGAGFPWLIRYFALMAPLVCALFVACLGLLIALAMAGLLALLPAAALVLLGVSPIVIGELTRGTQLGRTYYPGLVGLLAVIGFGASHLGALLSEQQMGWAAWTAAAIVGLNAFWNVRVFLEDILPSRMCVRRLIDTLRKRGIQMFSTYDTPFNDSFVTCLSAAVPNEFSVNLVRSLAEVRDHYLVVPGVNVKSVMMSDYPRARTGDNRFHEDPALEELIATRRIEDCAIACFKTMGSSAFWVHESEPTSYRRLILGDIGEGDLYRGQAWILDMNRVDHSGLNNRADSRSPDSSGQCENNEE